MTYAQWSSQDVGSPVLPGFVTDYDGLVTVTGAGRDIWQRRDQFQFFFQQVDGNAAVQTRAEGSLMPGNGFEPNAHPWAKAGVMIRESLDPASPFVALLNTAKKGLRIQYRPAYAAEARDIAIQDGLPALGDVGYNLRIERWDDDFLFYETDAIVFGDGQNEVFLGSLTVEMEQPATAGIAVTSHRTRRTTSHRFSSPETGVTRVEPLGATNQAPSGVFGDSIYLAETECGPIRIEALRDVTDADSLVVYLADVDPLLGATSDDQEGEISFEPRSGLITYTPTIAMTFDSFSAIISDGINEVRADYLIYRF